MSKKPSVTTVASGYFGRQALNDNFEALRDAFDNTLSRDGSTPNAMGADLDMNSNDILNAQTVNAESLRLNGVLVSSSDLSSAGATLYSDNYTGDGSTLAYTMSYQPFIKDNTQVYIDGVYQNKAGYSISGTTLTFSEAPPLNADIEIVVARSLTTAATDAANVGYNQGGTGAVNSTVENKLQEFVSVKDFGAVGDGVTDDTAAIQAAIDYAFAETQPFPRVHFPSGDYRITSEIDLTGNGNYVDVTGDGMRNSIITAASTIDSVFKLASTTDVAGRRTIRDMSIFCEDNAGYGVDAENMRYWTMENVEIAEATTAAVRSGNWVVRLFRNRFQDSPIGLLIDGKDTNPSAANNFIVMYNDFNTCPIGLKVLARSNDITIVGNSFDACDDVGVLVDKGGRDISIKDNYFEACGRDGSGISIPVDSTPANNITRAAAIILSHDPDDLGNSTFAGAISDNIFSNCNASRYIIASNVYQISITDNKIHDSYTVADFVEVVGNGSSSSLSKEFIVKGHYDPDVVTNSIVLLSGNDPEDNHCNMVIDNQYRTGTEPRGYFACTDPTSSSGWSGGTTINEALFDGCFNEFEYDAVADGTNTIRKLDVTIGSDSSLRGRYLRTHFVTKGSSTTSGVRVQIFVDSVEQIDISRTSSSYSEAGRGAVIYVPHDATSLEIRTRAISSSANAKMAAFSVCDAGIPLAATPFARLT